MKKLLLKAAFICIGISGSVTKAQIFNCGDTLIDSRDGQKYPTVLIGSACWMKKNLNYGTAIVSVTSTSTHFDQTNNSTPEKYAPMGNNANLATYGGLYEWPELMNYTNTAGGQGLCPNGWHVPTDAEFQSMIIAAGGSVTPGIGGNKLKMTGTGVGPNGLGTNTSGFSALPAGDRDAFGIFYGLGNRYIFWTSTETNSLSAYHYTLWNDKDTVERLFTIKSTGFSCRCVKNISNGIKESKAKSDDYQIYPNPVNETFALVINTDYENSEYSLLNLTGQILKTEKIKAPQTIVPVADISPGIYILHVKNGFTIFEKKIVITR